jgi:hypothetical protein
MKIEEFLQVCLRNLTDEAVTRSKKEKRKKKTNNGCLIVPLRQRPTGVLPVGRVQNVERSSEMALDVAWRIGSVCAVLRNPASNWEGAT